MPASTSAGSRLPWTTRSSPRRWRASAIGVRQSRPSTVGPASSIEREQVVAADAEVDRRGVRVAPAEFTEHVSRVRQHVAVVVASAQRSRPRVEELEGGGAVGQLCVDERDRRFGQAFHHLVPEHLVGVDQRLGVAVVLARAPLDQIARHRERRAGEREQRHVEFGDEQLDGVDHVGDVVELERPEAFDVVARPERVLGDRTGAGSDVDAESDGMRCHDDVAVEHGGVDAVAAHGLHRDLGGERRLLDRIEDRTVAANRSVLGQRSPGLAHEPHRRVVSAAAVRRRRRTRRRRLGALDGAAVGASSWCGEGVHR